MMQKSIQKEREKVGRLLFRVSAGLIALLVSLSYANERVRQSKIIDSMEEEASLLVKVSIPQKYMSWPIPRVKRLPKSTVENYLQQILMMQQRSSCFLSGIVINTNGIK